MDKQIFGPPDTFLRGLFEKDKCFSSLCHNNYAFMKLFTINDVKIKALGKVKMAWNKVLLNSG